MATITPEHAAKMQAGRARSLATRKRAARKRVEAYTAWLGQESTAYEAYRAACGTADAASAHTAWKLALISVPPVPSDADYAAVE